MYKIIGADQKEYGPVTAYQINQWIAQGRVNAFTKAQAAGGDWKALDQFPEFAAALASRAAAPPVSISPNQLAQTGAPARTSGLAVASLILGVLGLVTCGLAAMIGLILGMISMNQVRKSNGTLRGQGIALAGIIVSALFLLITPVAMLVPAFMKAKARAAEFQCVNNLRQLHIAAIMYAGAHTNSLPFATNWCDGLKFFAPYPKVFQCPATGGSNRCDFAYNSNLSGLNMNAVNSQTVLFFESDGGWNASGGPELMIQQPRHGRNFVVVFKDGHTEIINSNKLGQLRWNP